MPETKTKTIPSPSDGRDSSDDGMAATNRLVERPQPAPPTNSRRQPRSRLLQQGRRDATDFTASQEVKLKAGDMCMARIQISLSNLRTEMEETNKQLQNLCKTIKVDVDEE